MLCGSGLRAVVNAFQAIRNGDAKAIVAGGMESMSNAPHAIHLRTGVKFGDVSQTDTMIKVGILHHIHSVLFTLKKVLMRLSTKQEIQLQGNTKLAAPLARSAHFMQS